MSDDEYLKFILGNLETNKGGDQNAETPPPETPGAVKAKFARMFPGLAERLNGHLKAGAAQ